jgi:RND family efflux transporter MFP subunit
LLLLAGTAVLVFYITRIIPGPQPVLAKDSGQVEDPESSPSSMVAVEVVHPQKGMDYEVEQPGSVHAWETVQLRANVSGFLKDQNVDIGAHVKMGQVLAVIAVPEIDKQQQRNYATLELANAHVKQMDARVLSARADYEAAKAAITQAEAAYRSASAWVRYYKARYDRIVKLALTDSIEAKVVDEYKERHEASLETERSAQAAVATTQANLAAASAKIDQAIADVAGAKSEVKVAQADIEKTDVLLGYAKIVAPFDGSVTNRNFFPNDFIRSASEGAIQQPLLVVQRTDKLRVVVKVPDSAVPYVDPGDPAFVRIDSLPGREFVGSVSRKAETEDPDTRLMKVEIDLPNPTKEIGDGMYGKVRIVLDRFPKLLSVPSGCLVKKKGHWYASIVRDHHVHFSEVQVCKDNGTRVCVHSGLRLDDLVVVNPSASLAEGAEVEDHLIQETPAVSRGDQS